MATMRFLFGSVGSSGPTRPADAGPKCRSALLASRLPKPIGRLSTNTTRETSIGAPAEARNNHDRRPMGRQPQHRRDLGPYVGLFGNSLDLAIQSLDSLNDQIVQFIFTPKASEFDVDADNDCMQPKQREALKSSMALMRRLLLDAQAKFRKMVEDNKQLATRIDGDIQAAHEEVSELRTELADTNRRINELTTSPILAITDGTALRCSRCLNCSHQDDNQVADEVSQLRAESEKLAQQNRSLQREVEELRRLKEHMLTEDNNVKPQIEKLETDLQHAREALLALKADRKRLKAEKFDLLNQMKQLYGTLEDKERELRDFIRNYEQRMKESDESLKQMGKTTTPRDPEAPKLAAEREETEREKWSLLKHARDEAERSVALCAQLGVKETQLKQVQEELAEVKIMKYEIQLKSNKKARKQLSQLGYYSDQDSLTSKTNGFHTPTTTPINTPSERDAQTPSNTMATAIVPNEGALPPDTTPSITVDAADSEGSPIYAAMSVCSENPSMYHGLSRSAEELTHMLSTLDLKKKSHRRNNSKSTWGSISRVFSRSRSRRSIDASFFDDDKRTSWSPHTSLCASPLVEESYSEKLRLLEEAQGVPMEQWRASTVLAWLELSLGMPQYAPLCAENVKSGKILLELTDAELEAGLGIINPMHRRKLRLAIEEHRDPSSIKYPKLGELTHMWACGEWLTSIGLSQYIDTFAAHLVDGRMLENLTRKDLEKYLGVTRKFHQASILHGIHLLRMMCYDKQLIAERRAQCENCDSDTLVWTNQRFLKWARSIDLGEYADNLKDSGVHGALVVLEPSFTADTMAAALGIPQSKNIIRRHLMTELEAIVQPARYVLEQEVSQGKSRGKRDKTPMGSIGRSFSRSYAGGLQSTKTLDSRRSSLRGSLTRALGLKMKQDMQNATPSGPRSPQPSQSNALVETHRRVKSSGDIETVTITPV